jgi:1,2-phenylacetyl-CoA epoxidase PaaB subunit
MLLGGESWDFRRSHRHCQISEQLVQRPLDAVRDPFPPSLILAWHANRILLTWFSLHNPVVAVNPLSDLCAEPDLETLKRSEDVVRFRFLHAAPTNRDVNDDARGIFQRFSRNEDDITIWAVRIAQAKALAARNPSDRARILSDATYGSGVLWPMRFRTKRVLSDHGRLSVPAKS